MACLGAVLYDPTVTATVSTAAVQAMTAMDTTNARVTFTAPANGIVLVKLRVAGKGAGTSPMLLLGVMEGATVRGRQVSFNAPKTGSAVLKPYEAVFCVTGLTPGASVSLDAAWGVETAVTGTTLGWGGLDSALAGNAYGALSLEVWETGNLLGVKQYDPETAVSKDTATAIAMTVIDTTNLRLAFTAPASGRVFVRLRGLTHGALTTPSIFMGVLEGLVVKMRAAPFVGSQPATTVATEMYAQEAAAVVSGLTAGASLTWDAAYGVENVTASTGLKYGGPNDATANNAFGGFTYEIWSC